MTKKAAFFLTMAAGFMPYTSGVVEDFNPSKPIDTNAHRKARKERARMLTRQREEELGHRDYPRKTQGETPHCTLQRNML